MRKSAYERLKWKPPRKNEKITRRKANCQANDDYDDEEEGDDDDDNDNTRRYDCVFFLSDDVQDNDKDRATLVKTFSATTLMTMTTSTTTPMTTKMTTTT